MQTLSFVLVVLAGVCLGQEGRTCFDYGFSFPDVCFGFGVRRFGFVLSNGVCREQFGCFRQGDAFNTMVECQTRCQRQHNTRTGFNLPTNTMTGQMGFNPTNTMNTQTGFNVPTNNMNTMNTQTGFNVPTNTMTGQTGFKTVPTQAMMDQRNVQFGQTGEQTMDMNVMNGMFDGQPMMTPQTNFNTRTNVVDQTMMMPQNVMNQQTMMTADQQTNFNQRNVETQPWRTYNGNPMTRTNTMMPTQTMNEMVMNTQMNNGRIVPQNMNNQMNTNPMNVQTRPVINRPAALLDPTFGERPVRPSPVFDGKTEGEVTGKRPTKCGVNERWTECGLMCPRMCGQGNEPRLCPATCFVGCECKPGFVRQNTRPTKGSRNGPRCVKETECGTGTNTIVAAQTTVTTFADSTTNNNNNDMCNEEMNQGTCGERFGYVKRFFYNTMTRVCEPFAYSNCGGNRNRFNTITECENKCEKRGRQTTGRKTERVVVVEETEVETEDATVMENPCDAQPCNNDQRCVVREVDCGTRPCMKHFCLPQCPMFPEDPCRNKVCRGVPTATCEMAGNCRSVVFVDDNGRDVTSQCAFAESK